MTDRRCVICQSHKEVEFKRFFGQINEPLCPECTARVRDRYKKMLPKVADLQCRIQVFAHAFDLVREEAKRLLPEIGGFRV
jgi:hypothetical protein